MHYSTYVVFYEKEMFGSSFLIMYGVLRFKVIVYCLILHLWLYYIKAIFSSNFSNFTLSKAMLLANQEDSCNWGITYMVLFFIAGISLLVDSRSRACLRVTSMIILSEKSPKKVNIANSSDNPKTTISPPFQYSLAVAWNLLIIEELKKML